MIGLASALPFSVLAHRRASALHESIVPASRCELWFGVAFALIAFTSAANLAGVAADAGVALLFVTAWTDLRLRRVYLPVTIAAALELAVLGALHRLPADALIGAGGLGSFSLVLWVLAAHRGGWAGGDVLLFALLGAAFGFRVGAILIAIAFVGGAITYGMLIVTGLVVREAKIPMIALLYGAVPVYVLLVHFLPGGLLP